MAAILLQRWTLYLTLHATIQKLISFLFPDSVMSSLCNRLPQWNLLKCGEPLSLSLYGGATLSGGSELRKWKRTRKFCKFSNKTNERDGWKQQKHGSFLVFYKIDKSLDLSHKFGRTQLCVCLKLSSCEFRTVPNRIDRNGRNFSRQIFGEERTRRPSAELDTKFRNSNTVNQHIWACDLFRHSCDLFELG